MNWRIRKLAALLIVAISVHRLAGAVEPIDIGSRLELMVDTYLIESRVDAEFLLHQPTPREVALVHDAPWEGNACGYHTVFQDGDVYRMYYRGHRYRVEPDTFEQAQREVVCYAQSPDGVTWTKPERCV